MKKKLQSDLNTSYVTVKRICLAKMYTQNLHLNTSYVTVKL